MIAGEWVGLFSCGKDSSWALYRALETGLPVGRLVTVHPPTDSYLYHVPGTQLAPLAAESIGLPLVEVDASDLGAPPDGHDSTGQGDRELEPLERALERITARTDLAGITAGAAESEFQAGRFRAMCDRLGIELFAPLWGANPVEALGSMLEANFDVRVMSVAAQGLGVDWLGRRLDAGALDDLRRLNARHGVHVLGEGGEFETVVLDGPHMERPIEIEAEPVWSDGHGHLRIDKARLA